MKPKPLNGKTFTTLQIKSLKPGGLENNRRLLSDKWVRVRDLKLACEFFLQGIDDLYHKMGKPEVWRMNKDELVDACEDYVKKKFKLVFKDVLDGNK